MAKIYLSSTYTDLEQYRAKIREQLQRLGQEVLSMEDYAAEGRPPKEKCLADVRASDTYVGVFAWRYGFIPDGESKAITELEYREAVATGKNILIFLLREDVPWLPGFIDRDRAAIEGLREELRRKHLIQDFANADELAADVSASVQRLRRQEPAPTHVDIRSEGFRKVVREFLRREEQRSTEELENRAMGFRSYATETLPGLEPQEKQDELERLSLWYLDKYTVQVSQLKQMLEDAKFLYSCGGEFTQEFTTDLPAVLKCFQSSKGLLADGIFGPQTFKALIEELGLLKE